MKFHVFDTRTSQSMGVFEAKKAEDAIEKMARAKGLRTISPDFAARTCTNFVVEQAGKFQLVQAYALEFAPEIGQDVTATAWARHDQQLYRRWYRGQVGEECYRAEEAPDAVVELLEKVD